MARRRKSRPGRRLLILVIILSLAAGFFYSQQTMLQREELSVICPGLPENFDSFRITVVADLHGAEFGQRSVRLLRAVRAAAPDAIAIPGDLIDDPAELAMVPAAALGLTDIAPTYYVTGNHEWAAGVVPELTERLEACGVTVLGNCYQILNRDGQILLLAGVHDPCGYADQKMPEELYRELDSQWPGEFIVLLSHRNTKLQQYAACGYDLVLCGHAHGGIIRLPGVGGLFNVDHSLVATCENGLYTLDNTQMVVSRGLGNTPGAFRLFNRPQVLTVILETA